MKPRKGPKTTGGSSPRWAVQVIPGLEAQARLELAERLGEITDVRLLKAGERNSTLAFSAKIRPQDGTRLRLAEDFFHVVAEIPQISPGPDGLLEIENAVSSADGWNRAVTEWKLVRHRKLHRKVPYRIICRADSSARFSRHAMGRHVRKTLNEFRKPDWVEEGEPAPVEVWLHLANRRFVAMLRLSDRTMRHRSYKTGHLKGSLRPTLAAAMVMMSEPKPKDRFVDVMCGAGTIPLERCAWGKAQLVTGSEISLQALELCRQNEVETLFRPSWLLANAGNLPFSDYSVDKVVSNLPFGHAHGKPEEISELYRGVVREIERVLRPRGLAVLLTSRKRTLLKAVDRRGSLRVDQSRPVKILGRTAFLVRLERV